MSARWAKGFWLGKRFSSEEHVTGTTEGLVAIAGAVREHPEVVWDSKLFDGLVGVPLDPLGKNYIGQGGAAEDSEPQERVADLPRVVVPRESEDPFLKARNLKLTRAYFERYGWTEGCRKCIAMQVGDNFNPELGHNLACRFRIEGKFQDDPVFSKRLEAARLRKEEYLAKRVEAADEDPKRQRKAVADELQPSPASGSEERVPEGVDVQRSGDAVAEGGIPRVGHEQRARLRVSQMFLAQWTFPFRMWMTPLCYQSQGCLDQREHRRQPQPRHRHHPLCPQTPLFVVGEVSHR